MAKKPIAKITPAASDEIPAPAAKSTIPPKRLVATARTPAGRVSRSSPAPKDATPPKAAPLAAPASTASTASVVAPPAPVAKPAKAAAKLAKPSPAPAAVKPTVKPIKLTTSRKAKKEPRVITHDDIAVRAYLIAEKRQQNGWHAEPHEDWAEAERQLQAELLA